MKRLEIKKLPILCLASLLGLGFTMMRFIAWSEVLATVDSNNKARDPLLLSVLPNRRAPTKPASSRLTSSSVIINEVDADTPSTDVAEFVELFDGGVGNTPLDGLVVVFYNGADDKSYAAFDLDGFTTDANGYFVLGNAAVPGVGRVFPDNTLQNGADAVALYLGHAATFPSGTPVTTTNLIDALVYDTNDPDDAGLLVLLNSGQPQVDENGGGDSANHSNQRCPNGSGGARNTNTYMQAAPTPGAANMCPAPTCVLTPTTATNLVGTSHTVTVTVKLSGTPVPGVQVAFTISNGPNVGTSDSGTTSSSGEASFTYNSNGTVGTDAIQASGTLSGAPFSCTAQKQWVRTSVMINEVDADTPGTDVAEFVELFDGGTGNTPLDGLVVVFYNGTDDKSYAAFDLDGFTTDANGYFVLGNAAVPGVDWVFANNTLQNGADAVALYLGHAANFPNGTLVTTTNLIDALVYDTNDPDDAGLLVLLNSDQPQVDEDGGGSSANDSNQRCPNGSGGARNSSTYIQATPTPGTSNSCNQPPVAKCQNVTLSAGASCRANASVDNGSFDADGDSITLNQSPRGPYSLGNTLVTLTVTDSKGASSECTGTVSVINHAPTANAGPDQTVEEGATVTLSGSGSDSDAGQTLTYEWTQTSGPPVSLKNATTATATLVALNGGTTLTFQLKVTDPCLRTATDEVMIRVIDLLILQDERNGNCLRMNPEAGTYMFKTATAGTFTGQVVFSQRGNLLNFQSKLGDPNRLQGAVDSRLRMGKAILIVGRRSFTIADRNIDNNGLCP